MGITLLAQDSLQDPDLPLRVPLGVRACLVSYRHSIWTGAYACSLVPRLCTQVGGQPGGMLLDVCWAGGCRAQALTLVVCESQTLGVGSRGGQVVVGEEPIC